MKETLTAGVLLIGDELLSGSIKEKNLSHIAKTLEKRGIRVRETRIIPDVEEEIINALNRLRNKFDYVFTTGGIGPTHDDITSDAIAKAFGIENVVQQDVFNTLGQYLESKGVEFTAAAQRMAYTPEGAEIIKTDQSIIPTYRIDNVYVMAGVPSIMKTMLSAIVEKLQIGSAIISNEVHANVGEGEIAAQLEQIQLAHSDVDIGSYPQERDSTQTDYRVIFTVRGTEQDQIELVCEKIHNACLSDGYEAIIKNDLNGVRSS